MKIRRKQKIDNYIGYLLIGILLPFVRLLGMTMRRDHSVQNPPRRILFIKLLGLGSLVVASDAIVAIRKRFPETKLVLLTDANIAAGIAPFQLFDEIIPVKTDNLVVTVVSMIHFFVRSWRWNNLWVIDLEVYSKLTTVLALLTLARNRFGFFLPPVPFRKYLNTHNIPFDQSSFLEDNYRYMARQVTGLPFINATPPPVRKDEKTKSFIILNNTCSGLADVRKMPDRTFAEICRWLLLNSSYKLALLGAPGDEDTINRFIEDDPTLGSEKGRIINLAGAPGGFAFLYRFLRDKGVCLITIDSGPLHIARKLGLPTLSVWGPTNPSNYLEIQPNERDRHLSIYLATPCSPCVHRFQQWPCGGNNICMKYIAPSAVVSKLQELLRRLPAPVAV